MKLFYTGNSPYARRSRMAIREAGLTNRIEEVDVAPRGENDRILFEHGPGGKVPALLTDSGTFLIESLIIAHFLDGASGGKLYPAPSAARELVLEVEGIASLLMDSLFIRSHENRRDPSEQSTGVLKKEAERSTRCYDALEGLVERVGESVHMDGITMVASLGYADWRHPGDEWRGGRPKLAGWFEIMMQRPAMADTKPIF